MKLTTNLLVLFFLWFSGTAQTIEKSSIDSGGASTSNGNLQLLYTLGEVSVQEVSTASTKLSEGFINTDARVLLSVMLFLQGPMLNPQVAGLMNDSLRLSNYLPTTSPYVDDVSCNASVFSTTGNNAIVDWVWVELRDAGDYTKLVNARSGLLQRDGDVVEVDGLSPLKMVAPQKSYYVVVKHRNHLGAMTASVFALNETSTTLIDFTNVSTSTFGAHAQVVLGSGDKALWTGDTNHTNYIRFSGANNSSNVIKDEVLNDTSNGFSSVTYPSAGYLLIDVNLDGQGKFSGANNDSNIIKDNVLMYPGNGFGSPTFTIQSTVPNIN